MASPLRPWPHGPLDERTDLGEHRVRPLGRTAPVIKDATAHVIEAGSASPVPAADHDVAGARRSGEVSVEPPHEACGVEPLVEMEAEHCEAPRASLGSWPRD